MVLADLGLIDFIFLPPGKNPAENVSHTIVWFHETGKPKRREALRGSSPCQQLDLGFLAYRIVRNLISVFNPTLPIITKIKFSVLS